MKTYPYIGGIDSDCKTLFLDECYGIAMEHNQLDITGIPEYAWSERQFKNITHEYLQNTYGEVVSPEHAEFIVELAESHGIPVYSNYTGSVDTYFNFYIENERLVLSFWGILNACTTMDVKQITIPLPPKPDQLKNAGDNLILGCEDSKCNEWPQVGDEVQTSVGNGAIALGEDKNGMYIVMIDGCYRAMAIDALKKPKTPEEELRDDLMDMATTAMSNNDFDLEHNCYYLVSGLMKKYNIKPQ